MDPARRLTAVESLDLPPHPAWCHRADQPVASCASGMPGEALTWASHFSIDLDRPRRGERHPEVFLVRDDDVEAGAGEVQIGVDTWWEEERDFTTAEAKKLALDLLQAVSIVERSATE